MSKKHSCPYCGNNPVPHYINWYFDSLNILFERLQIGILANPLSRWMSQWEDDFALFMIGFGRLIGMINFGKKPCKTTLSRAKVLWEEAEKRGLEMREVRVMERSVDTYIVRKPIPGTRRKKIIIFSGLPRPRWVNHEALATMDDKAVFKKTCEKNGLPVPKGGVAWSYEEAKKIFDRIQKPVIVKPRLGSRGRHVVTYVRNHDDLRHAFHIARQLCLWVIVEEQIIGPVYRGTVIDYEVGGILSGTQPMVLWNGKKSLLSLLEEKNKNRETGIAEILPDDKMNWFLRRQLSFDGRIKLTDTELKKPWKLNQGKTDTSFLASYIPKKGEVVYLSEKIGVSYGGSSAEEYDIAHPDNKKLFKEAAKIFGDVIVGFDFMIPDISRSWKEQRCGFLEANTVPFINLHHHPHSGKPRNVAAKVWDLMKM
jgi:D-alanine-D-alanine ligase-like ATP-grasp enzyme